MLESQLNVINFTNCYLPVFASSSAAFVQLTIPDFAFIAYVYKGARFIKGDVRMELGKQNSQVRHVKQGFV